VSPTFRFPIAKTGMKYFLSVDLSIIWHCPMTILSPWISARAVKKSMLQVRHQMRSKYKSSSSIDCLYLFRHFQVAIYENDTFLEMLKTRNQLKFQAPRNVIWINHKNKTVSSSSYPRNFHFLRLCF